MSRRAEVLKRGELYPVSTLDFRFIKNCPPKFRVFARWTGERRPIKQGEWYLSGAIITAYRAYQDLDTPQVVAELVVVKPRTVLDILGPLDRFTKGEQDAQD